MLGISASNESTHKHVFIYFTRSAEHDDTNGPKGEKSGGNVIYRYELTGSKLSNPLLLLKLPPKKHPDHNGGALIIGPDKNIYILIGDGGNEFPS
jgi:glucose/arabinose dehydrogenase